MNYFIHESSYADAGCFIGEGTKIWRRITRRFLDMKNPDVLDMKNPDVVV